MYRPFWNRQRQSSARITKEWICQRSRPQLASTVSNTRCETDKSVTVLDCHTHLILGLISSDIIIYIVYWPFEFCLFLLLLLVYSFESLMWCLFSQLARLMWEKHGWCFGIWEDRRNYSLSGIRWLITFTTWFSTFFMFFRCILITVLFLWCFSTMQNLMASFMSSTPLMRGDWASQRMLSVHFCLCFWPAASVIFRHIHLRMFV